MLLFYNELFVCGKDDRVYVFNVETGERVDLIQLQQNDKPLCLFRLQGNIYIVSTNLIYILDMENRIKVPFDYSKYTASPVKGVDVYDDEDIAFWYEDGKIKWYRGMQPLMEIDDFLGEDIESVKIARTKSSMVALVTIREEGCVLWVNGRKLYDFGIDAEAIFRGGSFNHVDQKTLFIAISPHHYYTIDLNTFQMETHQTDYPLHGSLFAIDSNIITESEDGRMVINGHRLEHAAPVQYAGRLGRNTYYFVDAEGKLFSL
jgi:hypothetical protein